MAINNNQSQLAEGYHPIKTIIMDDDAGALNWFRQLLLIDPRTTVLGISKTPERLLEILEDDAGETDVFVIDVEYKSKIKINALFERIRSISPKSKILCVSQYGSHDIIKSSIQFGIHGYVIKEELNFAIATAVELISQGFYVFTPQIVQVLLEKGITLQNKQSKIILWKSPTELTPALEEAVELCIMCGMRAPLAGLEVYKSVKTMETYIKESYTLLTNKHRDQKSFEKIQWAFLKREDELFLLYTHPIVWDGIGGN